jgi:hypothetical protein
MKKKGAGHGRPHASFMRRHPGKATQSRRTRGGRCACSSCLKVCPRPNRSRLIEYVGRRIRVPVSLIIYRQAYSPPVSLKILTGRIEFAQPHPPPSKPAPLPNPSPGTSTPPENAQPGLTANNSSRRSRAVRRIRAGARRLAIYRDYSRADVPAPALPAAHSRAGRFHRRAASVSCLSDLRIGRVECLHVADSLLASLAVSGHRASDDGARQCPDPVA